MEHETKIRIPLWIYPSTEEEMKKFYEADNCKSPSEFIEKAINFSKLCFQQAEGLQSKPHSEGETSPSECKDVSRRL